MSQLFHIRWAEYESFSISTSSRYSGLISFRIDWFDLAVQETLKSLLQHHSCKASILWPPDAKSIIGKDPDAGKD